MSESKLSSAEILMTLQLGELLEFVTVDLLCQRFWLDREYGQETGRQQQSLDVEQLDFGELRINGNAVLISFELALKRTLIRFITLTLRNKAPADHCRQAQSGRLWIAGPLPLGH
jgi:hypothetical protein